MRRTPALLLCCAFTAAPAAGQEDGFVVHAVALAHDGGIAAFARVTDTGDDGCLLIRSRGEQVPTRLGPAAIVRGLAFAPDGRSLFATCDSGRVRQIDRAGTVLRTFELGRVTGFCRGVAVSRDGERVAAIDDERRVQVFAVASGARIGGRTIRSRPLCAEFLADGRLAGGDDAGQRHRLAQSARTLLWTKPGAAGVAAAPVVFSARRG